MEKERFEELVEEALARLPREFADRLDNVSIEVEDLATPSQLSEAGVADPHELLGLYQGIPLTRRPRGYAGALPDRIFIFRIPIEEHSRSEDDVRENVRRTVMHELGHYFGMDEEMLRDV